MLPLINLKYYQILFVVSVSGNSLLDVRIFGGTVANIQSFPYQISLQFNNQHNCGGSIIHPLYVLTAAHCFINISPEMRVSIRAGSNLHYTGGVTVDVCLVKIHENYDKNRIDNDIAILRLCTPLKFNSFIAPVALPESNEDPATGTIATVTGWGKTDDNNIGSHELMKVPLRIVDQAICKESHLHVNPVTDRMICAGLPTGIYGSCKGDSGGPLTVNGKQFGIVSWGADLCGRPQFPSVFTRITKFRQWIHGQINKE